MNNDQKEFNESNEMGDVIISRALMMSFIVLTLQYLLLVFFNLIGTSMANIVQTTSKLIVGTFFLYALPVVFKRNKLKLLIMYYISLFIFLVNFLLFPDNRENLIDIGFTFFIMCIPTFVYSISIKDWNVFKRIMERSAIIVLILGILTSYFIIIGSGIGKIYSMSLSYYMLLPAIIYLNNLFNKITFKDLLLFVLSMSIIISLGSRGTLLCIIVYIFLRLLKQSKPSMVRIYYYLVIITLFILSIVYHRAILIFLDTLFQKIGVNSRSINLLLRDEVNFTGRDTIFYKTVEGIKNNPFLGVGIGGDRVINGGSYVHNLFLEILANFGVVIGVLLLLLIIIMLVINLFVSKLNEYNFLIIWISIGFVHLMVSSSYLIDIKFWILMGLTYNLFKMNIKIIKKPAIIYK